MKTQNRGRICFECKRCWFSFGDQGYSEYTPGYPGKASCGKGHWDFVSDSYISNKVLHEALRAAETCKDFTPEEWAE